MTYINEPIAVLALCDPARGMIPKKIRWRQRVYDITTIGYHHRFKQGTTLVHIFSVANDTLAFRLQYDTETLRWMLEQITDA